LNLHLLALLLTPLLGGGCWPCSFAFVAAELNSLMSGFNLPCLGGADRCA